MLQPPNWTTLQRRGNDNATQKYVAFFAEGQNREAERAAFDAAWGYVCGLPHGHMIYYYSKYERTIWRQLQLRFPDVCHADEIEALYSTTRAIDLYYDIVKPKTEWPTRDHSIKTLASYLGFRWRDTEPSGAASIEWFNRFAETGDLRIKQRILDYNEDDCLATGVVLDAVRQLGLQSLPYETRCNPGKS